jgi:hypothetical protein
MFLGPTIHKHFQDDSFAKALRRAERRRQVAEVRQRSDAPAGWWSRLRVGLAKQRAARRIRRARRQAHLDEALRREGGNGHFKGWGGSL